jgi:RNA-binding protein
LKRLGKILHLSKSRSLIIKLASRPSVNIGSKVLDSRLREIGVIQDVFGPVAFPYVAIKPSSVDPSSLVGKIAYVAN